MFGFKPYWKRAKIAEKKFVADVLRTPDAEMIMSQIKAEYPDMEEEFVQLHTEIILGRMFKRAVSYKI